MAHSDSSPNQDLSDELPALRAIVEGTAGHTGQEFFQSLVRHLAAAVGTRYAFVAEFGPSGTLLYSTALGGSGSDYAAAIAVEMLNCPADLS